MSPIPLRDSQYFNFEESNLNSIVDNLKSNRKSGLKSGKHRNSQFNSNVKSSDKPNHMFERSHAENNDIGIIDDDPDVIKKRKQIRSRIAELASRKKGAFYSNDTSFEEPLEPIGKRNVKFDPNHYYDVPENQPMQVEEIGTCAPHINSPVEQAGDAIDNNSIQMQRHNVQNDEPESDSRKSLKIKESWESQKISSQLYEPRANVLDVEEIQTDVIAKNQQKKNKAVKNKVNKKKNVRANDKINNDDKIDPPIDNIEYQENHDFIANDGYIVEEPCYDVAIDYEYRDDDPPLSPLKLKNESVKKFKQFDSESHQRILDHPKTEDDKSINDIDDQGNILENKRTLKKINLPFVDKTNQVATKRPRKKNKKPLLLDTRKGIIIRIRV